MSGLRKEVNNNVESFKMDNRCVEKFSWNLGLEGLKIRSVIICIVYFYRLV